MTRRSARGQSLPSYEIDILRSLTGYELTMRAKMLYEAGWTLRSIGEAFDPPRARSTIRYWITAPVPITGIWTDLPTAPIPTLATPEPNATVPRRSLTTVEFSKIRHLAPSARKFRATMKPNHPSRKANDELTSICARLHKEDRVTIRDLAEAAGVSYRAMARRVR